MAIGLGRQLTVVSNHLICTCPALTVLSVIGTGGERNEILSLTVTWNRLFVLGTSTVSSILPNISSTDSDLLLTSFKKINSTVLPFECTRTTPPPASNEGVKFTSGVRGKVS